MDMMISSNHLTDTAQDGLLPYAKLGRGGIGELLIVGIFDMIEVDEKDSK